MVNHGLFYSGEQVNKTKDAILGEVLVHRSPDYTQIGKNSNILVGMLLSADLLIFLGEYQNIFF